MSGGFVYESETATYNSTTFSTKLAWALHLFRKQIYAFLKASTRSAQVNGEEYQYWDLDPDRINGGTNPLDAASSSASDFAHDTEDWQLVSQNFNNRDLYANEVDAIYNIQTNSSHSSSKPALVCYFVGRGGEHLAFTNYAQTAFTATTGYVCWPQNIRIWHTDNSSSAFPSGFGVVLSPYHDFDANIADSASSMTPYPSDCLNPIGPKTVSNSSTSGMYGYSTIIDDASNGNSFTFGFAVKGAKVICIVTSPVFDASGSAGKRYMYLLFGDIFTQTQDGDTKTYGGLSGYDNTTGETTTSSTQTSDSSAKASYVTCLTSGGERLCKFVNDITLTTGFGFNRTFPVGHSQDLSGGIPYSCLAIGYFQQSGGLTQTDTLIKDGNGYKGIIDPDMLRYVPATVAVGTLGGGNFIVPRKTSNYSSCELCFGWDPSNPSVI